MTNVDDSLESLDLEFEVCGDDHEIARLEALMLEEERIMNVLRKTVKESKHADEEALRAEHALQEAVSVVTLEEDKVSALSSAAAAAEQHARQLQEDVKSEVKQRIHPPPVNNDVLFHMFTQLITQQWQEVLSNFNCHLSKLHDLFFEGIHQRRFLFEMSCSLVAAETKWNRSTEQTRLAQLVSSLQEIIHSQTQENLELQRTVSSMKLENEKMTEELQKERDFEGAVKEIEDAQKRLASQQSSAMAARGLTCGSLLAVSMAEENSVSSRELSPGGGGSSVFPNTRDYSLPKHWNGGGIPTTTTGSRDSSTTKQSFTPPISSSAPPAPSIPAAAFSPQPTTESGSGAIHQPDHLHLHYDSGRPSSTTATTYQAVNPVHRARLIRLYEKYDRSKLPTVSNTLKRFKGKEKVLFASLVQQYGPEPQQEEFDPTFLPLPVGWVREENFKGDLYYRHADGMRQQWHRPTEEQVTFRTWL